MFNPSSYDSSKMTDVIFIAGVSYENIKNFMSDNNSLSKSLFLKPDILMSFPDNKELITLSILDFVFPDGIDISYSEREARFFPIVLTNEFGVRSYIYIMKLYEKIPYDEFFPEVKTVSESNSPIKKLKQELWNRKNSIKCKEKINLSANNPRTSDEYGSSNKNLYLPYAICLWSTISKIETYRKIMNEIYQIISYNNINLAEDKLRNFRNMELINLIIFLTTVLKPPSFSQMNLNFRFNNVEFYNPSIFEIPCSDYSIKVLFDCLEISVIIKLWSSILSEKHIILIANQNSLLFTICEGLLSLIFPFKWLHTYIPILPNDQLDYLESPTPFIMGVLSNFVDFQYLKEKFSNHVICDVNTSLIYGHSFTQLPFNEEAKLRKKLQFIKNPENYDIESIHNKINNSDEKSNLNFSLYCANIEDVCSKRSFSENVQCIFFRIFKSPLEDIEKLYFNQGVFDSQKFLEHFHHGDYKEFWEKIINTVAFEYFILNFQYLDHSYSLIFKNICKCETKKNDEIKSNKDKDNFYSFNINIPNTINFLFNKLETRAMSIKEEGDSSNIAEIQKYLERCKKLKSDYEVIISQINSEKIKPNSFTSNTLNTNINFNNNYFYYNIYPSFSFQRRISKASNNNNNNQLTTASNHKKRNNHSCDLAKHTGDYFNLNILQNDIVPNTARMRESFDHMKIEMKKNKTRRISNTNASNSESSGLINKGKIYNEGFRIYGKNGFIKFINDLFGILNMQEISHLGDNIGIADEIKIHLKEKSNKKPNYGKNSISKILEIENENEFDSSFMNSSLRLSFGGDKKNSPILEFPSNIDSFQYYILMACYLEEYSDSKELIYEVYKKAYEKDRKSFPRVRFYQFLDTVDISYLKFIQKDVIASEKSINNLYVKYKKFLKIINIRIENKLNGDKNKYDKGIINKENIIEIGSLDVSPNLNDSFENKYDRRDSSNSVLGDNKRISSDKTKKSEKKFSYLSDKFKDDKLARGISITAKAINESDNRRKTSHLGDVFETIINGEKLIENFKCNNELYKTDTFIKKYLINTYTQIYKTEKDPISLSEDISIRLFSLLMKNAVNKYKPDMISNILLTDLSNSSDFQEIKILVSQLQKINLKLLRDSNLKSCFWLNIYNFLVIFTIIFKKEIPSNYYEWYRYLKNSYFDIGGFEISLYEIETCILTEDNISYKKYGELHQFKKDDYRSSLKIDKLPQYSIYGISIPTLTSPALKVYFPYNLNGLLQLNAIDYFARNINIDMDNNILCVPELIVWIDSKFLNNIRQYEELLSEEFVSFLIAIGNELSLSIIKFVWTLNFRNLGTQ